MKKILIVDDEKDFCYFIKENLEMGGKYQVFVAFNGKDGLSAAASHKPDLILLDVMMPRIDGFTVLKELKSKEDTMQIPVIMLTAVSAEEAKEKAQSMYDEDYIIKPVGISFLKEKIEAVLTRAKR